MSTPILTGPTIIDSVGRLVREPSSINFVKYIVTHPCLDPMQLIVETFFPSLLELIATLTFVDLEDVLRDQAERQASRGASASSRKGGKLRRPVIDEDRRVKPRFSNRALTKTLFVTAPLEKIGYGWLLMAAQDQFWYRWQTLLEKADFCSADPITGPWTALQPARSFTMGVSGRDLDFPGSQQNRASWETTLTGPRVPPGKYTVTCAMKVKSQSGTITGARIDLRAAGGVTFPLTITGETVSIEDDEFTSIIVYGTFRVITLPFALLSARAYSDAIVGTVNVEEYRLTVWRELT